MKKREYAAMIDRMIPETPPEFKQAMARSLNDIAQSEPMKAINKAKPTFGKRRALAMALVAALLLATVALAASQWHIFDVLSFLTGASPKNADQVMQGDLLKTTVNGVEIAVKEAGYDGKTLFIQYSYRMPDVTAPLGMFADEYKGSADYGTEGIGEEELQLLYDRGVGWWIDHLWINGQGVDMPANSGASIGGSPIPGEIVQSEYWRLDNENVQLSGKAVISLPIGQRQPLSDYTLKDHPERYDENKMLKLPEQGIVTFTLDTGDTLSRVTYAYPNVPAKSQNVTAQVSEVCYSPLMTYITLKLEGDADAIAAYKAENGDGFYAEDGKTLLWAYGGMEVFGDWVTSLALVDGEGRELFPDTYGNNGYSSDWAEFVYPAIEDPPGELYLAPFAGGAADMTQAVKVK